ncbi:MAG: hypothetical protein UX43_C0007G0032 [Candidatus Giovannonibacteria bacterium GW2011_GWB1_46_20]|uniref:Serine protease n=2 Tax=Candidatus Giovannoniibacteriota TaxID=1752738 RepID=A0A0G1KVD4_9BACT|nr:MAG: hypothetical protein UW53_C0002G0034 [Candidatus Giovannonibacteria bacterium GW2011_GWA1_44_25]KKU29690.1 MAG: hypothetical protein UX43_C0007G0032 [Candidatus Giovannonibacteria bacterium GW2011_GWB1_46_20]
MPFFFCRIKLCIERLLKGWAMKRLAIKVLLLLFGAAILGGTANATPQGDAIRLVKKAMLVVSTNCRGLFYWGNGFFVESDPNRRLVLTAGHDVLCEPGDPSGGEPKVSVLYEGRFYDAKILKLDETLDYAVLAVDLPKEIRPYGIPVLENSGIYDDLSPVVIYTILLNEFDSNEEGSYFGAQFMLDTAVIAAKGKNELKLNFAACAGMSGGSVLFWHENNYYAIGLIKDRYADTADCSKTRISWATRIYKEFLNMDPATAPVK